MQIATSQTATLPLLTLPSGMPDPSLLPMSVPPPPPHDGWRQGQPQTSCRSRPFLSGDTLQNSSLSRSPTILVPLPVPPSTFLHTIDEYRRNHGKLNLPELLSQRQNTVPSRLLPYREITLLLCFTIVLPFHCL